MIRLAMRAMTAAGVAGGLLLSVPAGAQNKSESTEFLSAVRERDGTKATEMLRRPGTVIVNTREVTTGLGALHIVTERRDLTWLRFLLEKGASPDQTTKAGVTPLQIAANLGWVEGVKVLLDGGAQVDNRNTIGETALISAVHRRDAALVRALLDAGADPDRTDNSGRSARDYAGLLGSTQIAQVISEASEAQAARRASTYGPGA